MENAVFFSFSMARVFSFQLQVHIRYQSLRSKSGRCAASFSEVKIKVHLPHFNYETQEKMAHFEKKSESKRVGHSMSRWCLTKPWLEGKLDRNAMHWKFEKKKSKKKKWACVSEEITTVQCRHESVECVLVELRYPLIPIVKHVVKTPPGLCLSQSAQ